MDEQTENALAKAAQNLRIKWEVRQEVRTVDKVWLVAVFESDHERVARQSYDRLVRDNPEAYFELVAVLHGEVCRLFTPFKGVRPNAALRGADREETGNTAPSGSASS